MLGLKLVIRLEFLKSRVEMKSPENAIKETDEFVQLYPQMWTEARDPMTCIFLPQILLHTTQTPSGELIEMKESMFE